jgi:hypothetical protein
MLRSLPLFTLRQLAIVVAPLLLLIPLAWLAIRHEEGATEREYRALLGSDARAIEQSIAARTESNLAAIERGSNQTDGFGDFVRLNTLGELVEPKIAVPRRPLLDGRDCSARLCCATSAQPCVDPAALRWFRLRSRVQGNSPSFGPGW